MRRFYGQPSLHIWEDAAHWASWADCPWCQKRHPQVAGIMLQGLNGGGEMASMNVVRECVASLADAGCQLV